jgi:hypothetical protein
MCRYHESLEFSFSDAAIPRIDGISDTVCMNK